MIPEKHTEEIEQKMKIFHKKHDEDIDYNCIKCDCKISEHNKDWHEGMCDKCFDEECFNHDAEEIFVFANCHYCQRKIEVPEEENTKKYKVCSDCFEEKEEELSSIAHEEIYVEPNLNKIMPEVMVSMLLENDFPELWKTTKGDIKDMSRKEISESMFEAGARMMLRKLSELREGAESFESIGEKEKKE